jgi:hypothetical protein
MWTCYTQQKKNSFLNPFKKIEFPMNKTIW